MQDANSSSTKRSKSKSCKAAEITQTLTISSSTTTTSSRNKKKKLQESVDDDYAQYHGVGGSKMTSDQPARRRSRSANSSPSAWALSPGRSLLPLIPPPTPPPLHRRRPKSPIPSNSTSAKSRRDLYMINTSSNTRKGSSTTSGISSVSGVLRYLSNKIRKVSPTQEEEYHQFRVVHNRLLQWRFVNARAEASNMTALKRVALKKLYNAWLKMSTMRNYIVEKRSELQRITQVVKLCRVIGSQMYLLNEWGRIESRNCEAVGRLARKLSTISICFPFIQGAKGDITSILDAMSMATEVMDNIEAMIKEFQAQVEQVCFLLTELSIIVKEQNDCVNELEIGLASVIPLEAQETSLRIHWMEAGGSWS